MADNDDYYDPAVADDRPAKRSRRAAAVRASEAVQQFDQDDNQHSDDEYSQPNADETIDDPAPSRGLRVRLNTGGQSYSSAGGAVAGPSHSDSDFEIDDDEEDVKPKRKPIKVKLSTNSQSAYSANAAGAGGVGAESKGKARATGSSLVSSVFDDKHDFTFLSLKPDHPTRPFYISPSNGNVILEAFHPLAARATDFLIAIAEPVSRPKLIHEYKLTTHSLYAAVSVGLQTEDIIETLNRMSKVPVPDKIADFIRDCTLSYGKVKLVLKKNKHYVESAHPDTLRMLLRDPIISKARVVTTDADADAAAAGETATFGLEKHKAPTRAGLNIAGITNAQPAAAEGEQAGKDKGTEKAAEQNDDDLFTAIVGLDKEDNLEDDEEVHAFEILESEIEAVKKRCLELDYPMMEEYDFRNDSRNPTLEIDLKPTSSLRPYQSKSLAKMLGNGRARSGIIVLPCGAGKTLVGVAAACTIRKSAIVLCTSGVSVMQWKQQFIQWSTIQDPSIAVFTADQKEKFLTDAGIIVSTYSMVANRQKRSHDAQKMMDFISGREWGFVLLDEVHVVPAAMFRQVVTKIKAHTKLGLTATLVREDAKIDELNFLVGPKLYEANWMDLAANGHIATVQCAEVWCDMTPEFYREYLREKTRKKMLLYSMNPRKFQSCQFLINYHEQRGDKIIVFSDNVYALEAYAKKLGKLYIHGGTPQIERMRILQNFQHNPLVNTIFLSKVGDTSIDLPEATCLIQISSHFGSRRQEAQRLGRILRAKRRNDEGFNAFFYSLVSKDTQEIYYSSKRQGFLVDQGYAFKVITALDGLENMPGLVYSSRSEQIELLQSVLLANESAADIGTDVHPGEDSMDGGARRAGGSSAGARAGQATRMAGSLTALSGAQSMAYIERATSKNKQLAKESGKSRNKLFQKRDDNRKKKRAAQ